MVQGGQQTRNQDLLSGLTGAEGATSHTTATNTTLSSAATTDMALGTASTERNAIDELHEIFANQANVSCAPPPTLSSMPLQPEQVNKVTATISNSNTKGIHIDSIY